MKCSRNTPFVLVNTPRLDSFGAGIFLFQNVSIINTYLLTLTKNNSMENFKSKRTDGNGWIHSMTIAKGTIKRKRDWLFMEVSEGSFKQIIPETLSKQIPHYKDTEGNDVFTNDKMSLQYFGETKEGVVVFDERKLRYALDISDDRDMSVLIPLCEVDGVVVGNVFDEK